MAKVVVAAAMSHAPGVLGWPDAPTEQVQARINDAHSKIAAAFEAAKPDVIIAFLDDHFENQFRDMAPTFAIGVAPENIGPSKHWLEALRIKEQRPVANDPELADYLLRGLLKRSFDMARMGFIEFGNNLFVPMTLFRPQFDIPVVPIFTNVFNPPLTTMARAYEFGEAVRDLLESYPKDLRVALMATGGISHWPPFWTEDADESDEFIVRMKRYQHEGPVVLKDDPGLFSDLALYEQKMATKAKWPYNGAFRLINEEWDKEILTALSEGDVKYLKSQTFDDMQREGGHGGHEMLLWTSLSGAMRGNPGKLLAYEPVIEWMCGMGYILYDAQA